MNKARDILFAETGIFAGIRKCLESHHIGSTLVLAYSLIDTLAWLDLPKKRDEVQRADFVRWSERYLISQDNLECSALDLYAARCGVVHTMTPDSRLSREGKTIRIVYSWGTQKPYERKKLEEKGMQWIMIHVDSLCAAIGSGAMKFLQDVDSDPARLRVVNRRAEKLFRESRELPAELPW